MSRQHVDFTTSANSPPNAPADDGLDTGETNNVSVRPVNDGEPGQGVVFKRPSENLRTRTEITRTELEQLKYLSDYDRSLLLTSAASVTWGGTVLAGGTGIFGLGGGQMTLKPFTAPDVSSASRLIICANTASQITIRTRQNGTTGRPRAYSGANKISFDWQPVDTGTGAVVITVTGSPADNFHVQFDSNAISGTSVQVMLNYLNNTIITPGGTAFVAAGLEAVVDGTPGATAGSLGPNGGPNELGFPVPPAPIVANKVYLTLTVPESATRYMAGAADAEKHIITQAHLNTFFTALNLLTEGDVLCVRYDAQVMLANGGRRQSINELPENKAIDAGLNLFLVRRFPELMPGALPIATVVNGTLIFVNGRSFLLGETGPLVAAGASYQGSNAAPNSWADNTVLSGTMPVSFETALDTIIQTLGSISAPSGAHKVGIPAIAGSPISTSAGGVHGAVSSVLTGANAHINNATAAHAATATSFNTAGRVNISVGSINTQLAINDLDVAIGAVPGSILGTVNTFTKNNSFLNTNGNTTAVTAQGSGTGNGVSGFNSSRVAPVPSAAGVVGLADAGDGVIGDSFLGVGVRGSGFAGGVKGTTVDPSTDGGVIGNGFILGVKGLSTAAPADLVSGVGVQGDGTGLGGIGGIFTSAGLFPSDAVRGTTGGNSGVAGVKGVGGVNGTGVIGVGGTGNGASGGNFTGGAFGGMGITTLGGQTSGDGFGILATGGVTNGRGVQGIGAGTGVGVLGRSSGSSATPSLSTGVWGEGLVGVEGRTNSAGGVAVKGVCTETAILGLSAGAAAPSNLITAGVVGRGSPGLVGIANAQTLTAANLVGTGVYAIGDTNAGVVGIGAGLAVSANNAPNVGVYGLGTVAGGQFAQSGGAKNAIISDGYANFRGNATVNTDAFQNTLTKDNICKAWVIVQLNAAGAPTISSGFNIKTVSRAGNTFTCAFSDSTAPTGLMTVPYAVFAEQLDVGATAMKNPRVQNRISASFDFVILSADGATTIAGTDASLTFPVSFLVYGRQ